MSSDTTFEYILYNINEKINIIKDINSHITKLKEQLADDESELYFLRLNDEYNNYSTTIAKFNLEIIQFISEYYNINDDYKDIYNPNLIYTYSSNKNHYANIKKNNSKLFNLNELIDIFVDHCYEFKKFNIYNNSSISFKKSRDLERIIYNKLNDYILSENINDILNNIIYEYKACIKWLSLKINNSDLTNLNKLLNKFNNINLDTKVNELVFDDCDSCGAKMVICPSSSELICEVCGYTYQLEGTVLEDNQFYNQNEARYKHAGYEPSKHCKCWLERIQAKENNTINQEQIDKIENCIKRDNIKNKKLITIAQFRRYLKDCNLSDLNEHIALIRKKITGIAPPTLTYAEIQTITNSFSKSVKSYNRIKPNTKSNMIFYPYLLRKLIEMHISDYNRKKELLSFIHLQGSQTLSQNDKIWYEICKYIKEFVYIPTDRYKYLD